jgi:phosphatidate cytidylyltransferase
MIIAVREFLFLKSFAAEKSVRLAFNVSGIFFIIASAGFAMSLFSVYIYLLILLAALLISLVSGLLSKISYKSVSILFAAFFYIVIPLSLTPFLSFERGGQALYDPSLLLSILVILWVYDSFAYVFGVLFGRHRMFPSISPKKSWEGFAGGSISALLSSIVLSKLIGDYTLTEWIIISILIVLAGTAGDFYESYLKRKAGIKDSGNWLPGHGGILDRFDSFLFVIPVIFIFVKLIL